MAHALFAWRRAAPREVRRRRAATGERSRGRRAPARRSRRWRRTRCARAHGGGAQRAVQRAGRRPRPVRARRCGRNRLPQARSRSAGGGHWRASRSAVESRRSRAAAARRRAEARRRHFRPRRRGRRAARCDSGRDRSNGEGDSLFSGRAMGRRVSDRSRCAPRAPADAGGRPKAAHPARALSMRMDIEGAEYAVMRRLLATGAGAAPPRPVGVEARVSTPPRTAKFARLRASGCGGGVLDAPPAPAVAVEVERYYATQSAVWRRAGNRWDRTARQIRMEAGWRCDLPVGSNEIDGAGRDLSSIKAHCAAGLGRRGRLALHARRRARGVGGGASRIIATGREASARRRAPGGGATRRVAIVAEGQVFTSRTARAAAAGVERRRNTRRSKPGQRRRQLLVAAPLRRRSGGGTASAWPRHAHRQQPRARAATRRRSPSKARRSPRIRGGRATCCGARPRALRGAGGGAGDATSRAPAGAAGSTPVSRSSGSPAATSRQQREARAGRAWAIGGGGARVTWQEGDAQGTAWNCASIAAVDRRALASASQLAERPAPTGRGALRAGARGCRRGARAAGQRRSTARGREKASATLRAPSRSESCGAGPSTQWRPVGLRRRRRRRRDLCGPGPSR